MRVGLTQACPFSAGLSNGYKGPLRMNRTFQAAVAALMLAVIFAGSAAAAAIPETEEEALAYFEREAERGDPVSQYLLGFWYLKGDGLPQNYGEAMRWFRALVQTDYRQAGPWRASRWRRRP
jgi:TPR repeat protein